MTKKKMSLICLQLDLARQKENLTYVKEYFSNAKRWGYNAVLLYLENIVRTPSTSFFNEEKTYSMSEMEEIVAYAKELGLLVIPAFENLAHLEKFFAYPQLRDFAEWVGDGREGRGIFNAPYANCGCVSNDRLYEVMDKYITEVSSLFDSEYIHMGLDEPFDFAVCKDCKKRIEKGESKEEMFYKHVIHCHKLAQSLGKRMMMWDDFFEYADIVERLPRDIILCNWNYSFVSVEPQGHWTNRIKKDWFRLYEQLGFEYLFCVYAHSASSVYNLESFTKYAQKYNPIGGLCTAWEHSDSFYLGSYPFMAYAGKLWSGNIRKDTDVIDVYEEEIGNRELAKIVLSLNVPAFFGSYLNVDEITENEYFIRYAQRATIAYAVEKFQKNLCSDVLLDIYNYTYEYLLSLQMSALGDDIFNQMEGQEEYTQILFKLENIQKGFDEIEENVHKLWSKYRKGILSTNNSLEKKFAYGKERIQRIKNRLKEKEKNGILYFDTMLHDGYCTVKTEIKIKYIDDNEESLLYNGSLKPSFAGYEVGGCYGFRLRMKNKRIEYVILSVYGEGAFYPLHLRYFVDGELYVASEVKRIEGNVVNEENLLLNDTQFTEMGNNDGVAHFNSVALSKEKHSVKIKFKKFI